MSEAALPRSEGLERRPLGATIWFVWMVAMWAGFVALLVVDLFDNGARRSAERILPEYQEPKVGYWVPMWSKVNETTAFKINAFEPDRWLLWEKPRSSWAWKLVPLEGGQTRLISRLKQRYEWRTSPGNALFTLVSSSSATSR